MPSKQNSIQIYVIIALTAVLLILAVRLLLLHRELQEMKKEISSEDVEEILEEKSSAGELNIIIDDFGYRNDKVSDGFLSLGANLTFAVIPGHKYSKSFAKKAFKKGYEVIVHMPMESHVSSSGEEDFILNTDMTSSEIESRMEKVITHLPQAVGMNNHQGSKATENKRVMNVVGSVLKKYGMYFVDSRTTPESIAESMMMSLGVHTTNRDIFLDNEADSYLINKQLDQLISTAQHKGSAIGVGHARPMTLQVLQKRIPELKKAGFEFKFVSSRYK
ncbi:MAG TPA: divergent polysaccharide deacetylase family protein [Candidatus Marinimicrobia bacterium]|nr:divergent polysaccharide deacetylase family protein [Candidatus Neomarinimicrobiota bacterium]|tara:strand:+ start:2740 stop:3567 length:828 start_codon:yes stop_codon:yes gene_type:complete